MSEIRRRRKLAEMTQADLARELKCTQPWVSQLESGETSIYRLRFGDIYVIANLLKVPDESIWTALEAIVRKDG